jgi:hypothetical protein
LFDADGLAGKDLTEIDLLAVEADAASRLNVGDPFLNFDPRRR